MSQTEDLRREPDSEHTQEVDPGQRGIEAAEALAWMIAQEFVATIAEFHDAILSEDETEDPPPKSKAAGR